MTHPKMLRSNELAVPERLRRLVTRSMPPGLVDDRFDERWELELGSAGELFVAAAVAADDGEFVAYLGGILKDGQLHLDALIDLEICDPLAAISELLALLAEDFSQRATSQEQDIEVSVWAKPSFDWHDGLAEISSAELNRTDLLVVSEPQLQPHRALHQMRAPMADVLSDSKPLLTRAFVPGVDDEALRLLNNRAFAQHPDQGDQDPGRFHAGLEHDWVRPDGIRLYEADGQLAGFCWTKIHQEPPLGEIYVIGIDPAFHGRGLGGPMTAAGLHWLHQQGLGTAMLYVEANNEPALATYERLGFRTVRTDRSWRWLMPQSGNQSSR